MDGAKPKAITGATTEWVPPELPEPDFLILPLNLRSQLGRFGIGGGDLIVIDGMPEDAALTAGAKKPDGSWSLREADLDACSFMPLYGNGETYTLRACVLTPDPSDHGLAKTKGKAEIRVEVPLTPLPVLEAFDDTEVPAPAASPAPDTVILLPADPKLKATTPVPSPAPSLPALTAPVASGSPAQPAAAVARPEASRGTFDQQLAKLRAEWQAKVARQVAAAEERLKATHLAQLNRIQGAPESTATAESPAPRTEVEPKMDAQALDLRLAAARKQWQAEHEAALAQAREAWRSEEATRLATAESAWRAEAVQQRVALEARMEESYKERLAAIEAALAAKASAAPPAAQDWSARLENALADAQVGWEADEAERLAAAKAAWSAGEADRLAAAEARWRAEHDKKLEAVLASFGTMVKGQLGAIGNAPLLPAVEPAAPQTQATPLLKPADATEDVGWRETAAA